MLGAPPTEKQTAGPAPGLSHLTPRTQNITQPNKIEDGGRGSKAENVYFHAQGSADLADSGTTGPRRKAVSDEARPWARRASRARPAGGSGRDTRAVGISWRHPWVPWEGATEKGKQRAAGWKGQAMTAR